MKFTLHPQLQSDCYEVIDLKLSKLLLVNALEYPWLILVPRVSDAVELIDLAMDEQHELLTEINCVSQVLVNLYNPEKLNVATLGNRVRQLHIHIIARFESDSAWPNPVFTHDKTPYLEAQATTICNTIRLRLQT